MAVSFKVPKSPAKSILTIDNFLGVDFTNSPANIDEYRSPNCVNMIRDVPGKVRKCMGWESVELFGEDSNYEGESSYDVENAIYGQKINPKIYAKDFDNLEDVEIDLDDVGKLRIDKSKFSFNDEILTSDGFKKLEKNPLDSSSEDVVEEIDIATNKLRKRIFKVSEDTLLSEVEEKLDEQYFDFYGNSTEDEEVEIYGKKSQRSGGIGFIIEAQGIKNGESVFTYSKEYLTDNNIYFNKDLVEGEVTEITTEEQASENGTASFPGIDTFDYTYSLTNVQSIGDKLKAKLFVPMPRPLKAWTFNLVYLDYSTGTFDLQTQSGFFDEVEFESKGEGRYSLFIDAKTSVGTMGTITLEHSVNGGLFANPYVLKSEPIEYDLGKIISEDFFSRNEFTISSDYQFDFSLKTRLIENAEVNGFHKLLKDEYPIYHVGTKMLRNGEVIYEGANNHISKSWEFENKLYIIDGKKLLVYKDVENKSDLDFDISKTSYTAIYGEEFTMVIKKYDTPRTSFTQNCETTSETGRFEISEDLTTLTYTDTLLEIGDFETITRIEYHSSDTSGGVPIRDDFSIIGDYTITAINDTHKGIVPVEDDAYVPLLTISKDPSGGGTPYEDLNLLSAGFQESFLGQASVKDYYLSFSELDDTYPIVEVMDADGNFQQKTIDVDFTFDATQGKITFTVAPGVSPVSGEDNVKITAYRTVEGYADRVNKCTIGVLYGVNGALDRLFLSGNPDYINYDWFSGQYDPTYFTDTSYSMLGSSSSAIMGYSVINGYLATHKDYMEKDQNIILRQGDLEENLPVFRIINTLQGAGAVAKYSFSYLSTEPLFLTRSGVYAVTAQDITGEKYAQNRSFFIDGKLLEEPNLENAIGFTYKDMYWLCINGVAYILDGLQPVQTDKQKPYSTRQYVGYYRTNIPARCMWEHDNRLYFGTDDGRVCAFHTDKYALASYNDDGDPIEAIWETPDIDGQLFYKNKTLRYIALRLDSAIATSVNIWVMNRGLWQFIKKDDTSGRYLSFSHLVFSKFSFSGDKTQHTFATKVRVKKVDKFRLRLVNDSLDEPFGLFNIAFEYVENGNYKG